MHPMHLFHNAVRLAVLGALLSGCAASKATYHLIDAQRAVKRAEERQAEELAVYEYTLANLYLQKAWEEAGYSDYKTSVELCDLAAEWADKAIIAIDTEGRDLDLVAPHQARSMPAQLAPTEPTPTEAAPTEPTPTEPAPTEAAPTEPTPTEAAPTEAVPTTAPSDEPEPTVIDPIPEAAPNPWDLPGDGQ